MPTRDDLIAGLKAADAAGNKADAKKFADAINNLAEPITDYSKAITAPKLSGTALTANRIGEAVQGATLGWGDELTGALGGLDALVRGKDSKYGQDTFLGGYDKTVGAIRPALKEYEAERPWEALGLNALGSVPTLVAAAPEAALKGAGTIAQAAPGVLERMGQAMKVGAGLGAVSGAGYADGGIGDRAVGATGGAIIGGGLGAAIPAVPAAVRGISQVVQRAKMPAADFALTKLSQALTKEGTPIAKAKAALGADPTKSLIDVGQPNGAVTSLAEQGALSGEGQAAANKFFDTRTGAQEQNLTDAINSHVSNQNLYTQLDEQQAQRAGDAGPLYQKAYNTPYRRTPKLVDLSQRPAVGGAARTAITRLTNDPNLDPADVKEAIGSVFGNDLDNLSDEQAAQRLTQALGKRPIEFKVLDYIKRGLDAMSNAPDATPEIRSLRTAWREELKNINPNYQTALNAYAGPSAIMDAVDEGRDFMSKDPEEITKLMGQYGDSEQQGFRIGMARGLRDLMSTGNGNPMSLANKVGSNTTVQARLQAGLSDAAQQPVETLLQRNGWRPASAGVYKNITKPGQTISLTPGGQWTLEQASKTGRSSSVINAGADQATLESAVTGNPVVVRPPPASADDFIALAQEEQRKANLQKAVVGNSKTASRQEGAKNFDTTGDAVQQAATYLSLLRGGHLGGFLGKAIGDVTDRVVNGLTDERRAAVMKLLTSQNPDDNRAALEQIGQLQNNNPTKQLYNAGITPVLTGAGSGQVTGRSQ